MTIESQVVQTDRQGNRNLFFTKETNPILSTLFLPFGRPSDATHANDTTHDEANIEPQPNHTVTTTSMKSRSTIPSMYRDANTFQTIRCRNRNAALSTIPRSGVVGKRLCHMITSCKWDSEVIHMQISSVREGSEHGGAKRLEHYQQGRKRADTVIVRTKAESHRMCSKQSTAPVREESLSCHMRNGYPLINHHCPSPAHAQPLPWHTLL